MEKLPTPIPLTERGLSAAQIKQIMDNLIKKAVEAKKLKENNPNHP